MSKKSILISVCLSVLLLLSPFAFPEEISLTSCDWKPYNGEGLVNNGFTCEIISKAFKRMGHSVRFTFLPWKRALISTQHGEYHGLFAAYNSEERAKIFAPSDSYLTTPLVLCEKKESAIQYKTVKDLIPYRIGVVRGYVNTPEIDSAEFLQKDEATNDLQNLKKLLKGRVDLIVIDKYLAIYNLKNEASLEGGVSSVTFLSPPLEEKTLHIMFSKAIPNYEKYVMEFNRGLAEIKKDGTVDDILSKYGF